VLDAMNLAFPRLELVWVDQGYTGAGKNWIEDHLGWRVEVVQHPHVRRSGFIGRPDLVLWRPAGIHARAPRAWLPRTAAEAVGFRAHVCLADSQPPLQQGLRAPLRHGETLIYIAMGRLMLRRLARI
jgi:putative transposase